MATVANLNVAVTARTRKFRRGMKRSQGIVSRFAGTVARAGVKLAAFSAVSAAAGATVLGFFVRKEMKAVDATAKLSDRIGIATEKLVGLQHAAEITGAGTEVLNKGLMFQSKALGEAKQGIGEARYALDALGLKVDDIIKMSPDQAFLTIAESMKGLATQSERNYVATKLYGRAGQKLVNTLSLGSAGLREMVEESRRLYGSLTRVDARKIEQANDAIQRTKTSFRGLIRGLAVRMAPTITKVANVITRGFILIREKVAPIVGGIATMAREKLSRLVKWAMPLIRAYGAVLVSYFGMIWEGIKIVGNFIGRIFTRLFPQVKGFSSAMTDMRDLVIFSLITVQFVFQNWRDYVRLYLVQGAYNIEKFANQVKHIFTVAIPTYARYLLNSLGALNRNIDKLFRNLGGNLGRFATSLPALITGKLKIGDIWQPLLGGMETVFGKMPKIAERKIGVIEKVLGDRAKDLKDALGGKFQKFFAERMKELGKLPEWLAGLLKDWNELGKKPKDGQDITGTGGQEEAGAGGEATALPTTSPAALQKGTVAAYSAITKAQVQHQARALKAAERTATNTAKSNELQKDQVDHLSTISESLSGLQVVEI